MRNSFFLPIFIIIVTSCTVLPKEELANETLFTIDGEPTSADAFLYVYEKNNLNNDSIYTKEDIDKYFELFKNFKLKVKEAEDEGVDTTEAFLSEFNTYKDQLIKPYLAETQAQESLVRETYDRMKYEIDASHILVTVPQDALPEDTVSAYQKILEIHEKAASGQDFGELAAKFSQDPSARTNHGRLGYFSAFQMVFPFENAAYNTPVNSVSGIFRTKFGYHILYVHDKRQSRGKVRVSHIMLQLNANMPDSISAKNKVFEIHDQLMGGADWNELCQRYSNDTRTKDNGGTLPFIGIGQINDKAFEDAAFNLQNPGDISDPVRSRFGWHIIKLEEKKGLDSFEQMKDDLEERVSQDDRSKLSKRATIEKLKAQNNFRLDSTTYNQLTQMADSTLLHGKWDVSAAESIASATLFTLSTQSYNVSQALKYIETHEKNRSGLEPKQYMEELLEGNIEQCLLEYEEAQLVAHNRDFRMLLNEYYEGIMLFDIMNRKVWDKAVSDQAGLQKYFESVNEKYQWGKRVDASILTTSDPAAFKKLKKSMNSDSIALFAIEYHPSEQQEVLTDANLDTLANLYKTYGKASVSILSDKESMESPLYADIIQFFDVLGIPLTHALVSHPNKIRLELNSKSKKSLEFLYNKESALTLQVAEGLFEKGDNALIDSISWKKGAFEIVGEGNYNLIVIQDVLEPQPKLLEETKGSVISDYQNYLEKEWIKELNQKHKVNINTRTLDKIKKSYRKKLNSPA